MKFLKAFTSFLLTFLTMDVLWVTLFAQGIYQSEVGGLLTQNPKFCVVAAFYVAYTVIAVQLAIVPAVTWRQAALNGMLLGIAGYGTYAMTNYAILKDWTHTVLIVDVCWGATVTSVCSVAGFIASSKHA